MKIIHISLLALVLACPLSATKYAGEIFAFSPGVQNQAMGNTGLTFAGSNASGWWNPALLALPGASSVELMRSDFFEGLLTQNQINLQIGSTTRNSISINHLAIDKIKLTRLEDENAELSNSNRPYVWKTVTNQDLVLYGGFARKLNDRLAIGLAPKLAYRSLAENSGFGFGADLGAYWELGKGWAAGMNFRDFFSTQIIWESGEHELAMPNLDLELGYAFQALKYDIPVQVAVRTQAYPEERGKASTISTAGLSADLHAGVMVSPIPMLRLMGGYDTDSFTTGIGVAIKALGVDYAFRSNSADGLGYTQKISLSYQW